MTNYTRLLLSTLAAATILSSCGLNRTVGADKVTFSKVAAEANLIEQVRASSTNKFDDVITDDDIIDLGWEFCGDLKGGSTPEGVYTEIAESGAEYDSDEAAELIEQLIRVARVAMETLCPEAM